MWRGQPQQFSRDPLTVPYIGVGQCATNLWENTWTYVNGYLNTQSSADYALADLTTGSVSHAYVVTVANNVMTVTMDGYQIFNGTVSLPPVAYSVSRGAQAVTRNRQSSRC